MIHPSTTCCLLESFDLALRRRVGIARRLDLRLRHAAALSKRPLVLREQPLLLCFERVQPRLLLRAQLQPAQHRRVNTATITPIDKGG